jgi:hypothetical protein
VKSRFPIWLALCAACSQEPTPVSTSVSVIDSDQQVTITLDQTRLEIAPDVRYVLSQISSEPGVVTSAGTLDGHPFGVRRGEFFIGPESYGQPPAGTTVYVRKEGVFFGEERRGDLPAARSE